MIFDKNYDRSLWLLLASDKVNREKIIDVIKNIPDELNEKICLIIEKYNKDFVDSEEIRFEVGNLIYFVKIIGEELSIKFVKNDEFQKEIVKLFLNPLSESSFDSLKDYTPYNLGGFIYSLNSGLNVRIGSSLEEYDIVKTPFGNYTKIYSNNNPNVRKIRRVNVHKFDNGLYLHQFKDPKKIYRKIRSKGKK